MVRIALWAPWAEMRGLVGMTKTISGLDQDLSSRFHRRIEDMIGWYRLHPGPARRLILSAVKSLGIRIKTGSSSHRPPVLPVDEQRDLPVRIPVPDIGHHFLWSLGIRASKVDANLLLKALPHSLVDPLDFFSLDLVEPVAARRTVIANRAAPPGATDRPLDPFVDASIENMLGLMSVTGKQMRLVRLQEAVESLSILDRGSWAGRTTATPSPAATRGDI